MQKIGSLLTGRPLFTISGNLTVVEAAQYMTEKKVGALPVVDGIRLVGLFSERDVITRIVAKGADPAKTHVRDVMTKDLVVAGAEESVEDCMRKMGQAHCRHLPVVSGESLVGFVSLRDLLQRDLSEKEENLEYLRSYMFTVQPGPEKK